MKLFSVYNILKLEHEKVRQKISDIKKEKNFEKQKECFLEIKKDLRLQLTLEEVVFFKEILKHQELNMQDLCSEVWDTIAELSNKEPYSYWNELLNDLSEEYEEYSTILEEAVKDIPSQERKNLEKKFSKLKRSKWRLFFYKILNFFAIC